MHDGWTSLYHTLSSCRSIALACSAANRCTPVSALVDHSPFQGRSGYESLDEDGPRPLPAEAEDISGNGSGNTQVQQYDVKGAPVNRSTVVFNDAQVRAKNEVLEAVGVCERKRKRSAASNDSTRAITLDAARWAAMTEDEEEAGSYTYMTAELMHFACTWWLQSLIQRIQV